MTRLWFCPFLLSIVAMACAGKTAATAAPTSPPQTSNSWSVRQTGEIVAIAYGSGTSFPQYAALHTASGHFRMNFGPSSGWGTSLILLPPFWSDGTYHQGGQTTATWVTVSGDLDISFSANVSGLAVSGHVRLSPPIQDSLSATVTVTVAGTVALDARPNEAFKPVMLSSMHVAPASWDAPSGFVGAAAVQIPDQGWILQPPVAGTLFGLNGGTSTWKTNAPAIEITMDRSLPVTGWVTKSDNPNDDNVGLWAASDQVLSSWQYRLRAFKQ